MAKYHCIFEERSNEMSIPCQVSYPIEALINQVCFRQYCMFSLLLFNNMNGQKYNVSESKLQKNYTSYTKYALLSIDICILYYNIINLNFRSAFLIQKFSALHKKEHHSCYLQFNYSRAGGNCFLDQLCTDISVIVKRKMEAMLSKAAVHC